MKLKAPESAFTLIELLIVVAIIAILAAIAVPNFLEAQVRAKASRVRTDLRSVSTGLEAYAIDNNNYPPNDGGYSVIPIQITTPIAYMTNARLKDPFVEKDIGIPPGPVIPSLVDKELLTFYTYTKILTLAEFAAIFASPPPPPVGYTSYVFPQEGVDASFANLGAVNRYGSWRLVSNGPDRIYARSGDPAGPFNPNPSALGGSDIPYDPTNGTVSWGNILRTHKDPNGIAKE